MFMMFVNVCYGDDCFDCLIFESVVGEGGEFDNFDVCCY